MKKPWGGAFSSTTHPVVEDFTQSLSLDSRLALYDILQNKAYAEELHNAGILSLQEKNIIQNALLKIENKIKENKIKFKKSLEDIHMNIESLLIKETGETGKKIHTGRSRNDQVLTDVHLYMKDEIKSILGLLINLQEKFIALAEKNFEIIIPGYTHLQQAQPVLASHYFMAFFFKLKRDFERFKISYFCFDKLPLGAAALAGSGYPINRKRLAKLLGFSNITENSMDTVSSRDALCDFIYASSLLLVHLSRLCEDFIIWLSQEFSFISISDAFLTGSSIMPNKKNPDVLELIRGKTAKLISLLNGLLVLLKGLPLTYNRDLQEDKFYLFEAVDNVKAVLNVFIPLLQTVSFNKESIEFHLKKGYLLATDIADYLVKKGVPFRKSHEITGRIIKYLIENNKSLFELSVEEFKKFSKEIDSDIFEILDYRKSIENKKTEGSTSFKSVKEQIKKAKEIIKEQKLFLKKLK